MKYIEEGREHRNILELIQFRGQLASLFNQAHNLLDIPQPEEIDRQRILGFIRDNNDTSRILQSHEYLAITEREKQLKGSCKLGTVICIDGRISIIHQFGRTANTWEVAGSLVDSEEREDGKLYLSTQRLIDTLVETAVSPGGRELLEIVTAHTSSDPHHKCGQMTKVVREAGGNPSVIDKVALAAAQLRAQAIENKYNEILTQYGKKPQKQVSVVAMIDTDTMGMTLNPGKDEFSTTKLLMQTNLTGEILEGVGHLAGDFGSMKHDFTKKDSISIITYATRVEAVTRFLMTTNGTRGLHSPIHAMKAYIENNYPNLVHSQKKALLFTLCRTIANQYVTGLSGEHFDHPYNEHDERYISVSPFGKPFGRFDYTKQTFGSTPNNRKDMHNHIVTKLSIMDSHENGGQKEPRIIFLSTPVKKELFYLEGFLTSTTYKAVVDTIRKYYVSLVKDSDLHDKIYNREAIVVPLAVDEDTGEAICVLDGSPLFVNQGKSLPEMPSGMF